MKILITGASGFVGKHLLRNLLLDQHEVVTLTRDSQKIKDLGFPVEVYEWDPKKNDFPNESLKGIDAVINLMGENLSQKRWSESQKKKLQESRILSTKKLVRALDENLSQPLKAFISVSAVGIYPVNSQTPIDESYKDFPENFLSNLCQEWEKEALKLKKTERLIIPRLGVVLGPGEGMLARLNPIFRMGLGGTIGLGKQWMSWIHVDDLVQIITSALTDKRINGVINATSPNPVTNAHFTKAFSKALKLPALFPVPPIMVKIAFGEMSTIILDGQKIIPQKLSELKFTFKFPTIEKALNDICLNYAYEGKSFYRDEFVKFQYVKVPVEKLFPFFATPENLEKLTPDFLNFKILSSTDKNIKKGTEINYQLSLRGIPMKWKTLITDWQDNQNFSDLQVKGPYRFWHHTHLFHPYKGGTLIEDRVVYRVPFGPLGEIVRPFIIKDIGKIFSFRKKTLDEMISKKAL